MLIWKGKGGFVILLPIIFIVLYGFTSLDSEIGIPLALITSAVFNYVMWKYWFVKGDDRTMVDKETGEETVLKQSNGSLFFIPSEYWTYIFAGLAFVTLFLR